MSKKLSFLYESVRSREDLERLDLLESCYAALDEEVDDSRYVITTANRYTFSTLVEYLERARRVLETMCETVTIYFNNYVVNKAAMLNRYGEIIAERYKALGENEYITYKTYRYEHLFDSKYPKIISPRETFDFMSMNSANNAESLRIMVDDLIAKFGEEITGGVVDPHAIADSIDEVIRAELQGREVVKTLTPDQIALKIRSLTGIKSMKKRLTTIKNAVVAMYENLMHEVIESLQQIGNDLSPWSVAEMRDPRLRQFNATDRERFSTISVETTRLVDGFIKAYASAYRTTIEVYNDKITEDTNLINEILVRTKLFTAVNPRTVVKGKPAQKAALRIKG